MSTISNKVSQDVQELNDTPLPEGNAGHVAGAPTHSASQSAPAEKTLRQPSDKATEQKNTGLGRKTSPIIGASALLASKYPAQVDEKRDARSKLETRIVLSVVAVITALIVYGWMQWSTINFQQEVDFHYNAGLIGGIMMLVVLLYAFRKRARIMRNVGSIETWYYFHLFGGVLGPILILFHTDFTLKSVNASVALIAMGLVVISGIFGRYVYTRIGYGLHRKLLSIKDTEKKLIDSLRLHQSDAVEVIERRLSKFALASLAGPRSMLRIPLRFIAIRTAAATCYIRASEDLGLMLRDRATEDGWNLEEFKTRLSEEKLLLRDHINAVVDIARIHLFERLLVKWRVFHIPLLYILLITGLVHVLAVHMY